MPDDVLTDVGINIYTGVQENAMPGAVTTTMQRVEYEGATDRQELVIKWLGMSAVEVAESGYGFYASESGRQRGGIEVAEARFAQDEIKAGRAYGFLSPKMTRYDADEETAKAENLYDADGIRISRAITDSRGNIVARQIESLLVSDVPFEAWIAMLKDSGNVFGKAFDIRDERSALSVMELFREFDVSEDLLPEGPVNIVAAVIPYIADVVQRKSVLEQLNKFRGDQQLYREQAERTAQELLTFDLELARSLYSGTATKPVEAFIASLQHQWGRGDRDIINKHDVAGQYIMTRELAAVLEKAQQNLLNGEAAILTKNDKVMRQMNAEDAEQLYADLRRAEVIRAVNPYSHELRIMQLNNRRNIARQNLEVGGGCGNKNAGRFENDQDNPLSGEGAASSSDSKEGWSWKKGVCRVEACKSPKPTEVGPCSVCRNCQHQFDLGIDPTGGAPISKSVNTFKKPEWLVKLLDTPAKKTAVTKTETKGAESEPGWQVDAIFKDKGIDSFDAEQRKTTRQKAEQSGRLVLV